VVDRTPYQIEHRLLMADGRIKWVQERCESVFDADGKPLRSVGTVQDITERREWAQRLSTMNEQLEHRSPSALPSCARLSTPPAVQPGQVEFPVRHEP